MPTYIVEVSLTSHIQVKALNEEEAIEKAYHEKAFLVLDKDAASVVWSVRNKKHHVVSKRIRLR